MAEQSPAHSRSSTKSCEVVLKFQQQPVAASDEIMLASVARAIMTIMMMQMMMIMMMTKMVKMVMMMIRLLRLEFGCINLCSIQKG